MRPRHVFRQVLRRALLSSIFAGAYAPLLAQARAANDPLSGAWSGYIGKSAAKPSAVKVEFKLASDGRVSGKVTGPQLTPGDINNGRFDAATGVLKFAVVLHPTNGDGGGNITFDGRLAHDTVSGTMLLGDQSGVLKVTKDRTGAAQASAGPQPAARPADEASAAVRRGFVEVSDWITRAADLVPADKYSYRPVATVRTFGQIVGHVVDGSHYYCGRGAGKNVQWLDGTEKGVTTKAALVQALKQAFAECTTVYDGANQIGPLMNNVAHSSLHYGNLVTYIRMLGLVPPSS